MTPELPPLQSELGNWVGPEIAQRAGFRPESSGWFFEGKDFTRKIYSGFIPNPQEESKGLHIVVGVKVKEGKKITWYFGTFEGTAWRNMTEEEAQRYVRIEREVLRSQNIIQPSRLEGLIQETLDSWQK